MVKNIILYIFIYTLSVGCSDSVLNSEIDGGCEADCFLEVEAPSLSEDENGYYHIEWLDGYTQTFTTLDANIGTDGYHKVHWDSDLGIMYSGEFISCVNNSSYSNGGTAHTVMSVWEGMIEDTITVYSLFIDWCNIEHIDSIKVVVDNEI